MTDDKGRGLFATRKITKGEKIIVEKAIAIGSEDTGVDKQVLTSGLGGALANAA